jgi:type IV pilus assembly protein PilB
MARRRLGELLIEEGRLDPVQLQSAMAHQSRWGGRLGQALVNMGLCSEPVVMQVLARQLGVRFVEIGDKTVPAAVLHLVPERLIRKYKAFPVGVMGGRRGPLVVALGDPADLRLVDDLAFATGMGVEAALATPGDIEQAIARHLDGTTARPTREIDLPQGDPGPMRLMHWKQ